jgi:hypothetical protein
MKVEEGQGGRGDDYNYGRGVTWLSEPHRKSLTLLSKKKGESKAAGAFGKKRGCAENYIRH